MTLIVIRQTQILKHSPANRELQMEQDRVCPASLTDNHSLQKRLGACFTEAFI